MGIRFIASDVDGTILPRGGEISERTRAAVRLCGEQGVPFVIASGRWYVSAKEIADRLELRDGYMIIANGGAVVDMVGKPLMEWVMSRDVARKAYEIIRRYDVMANSFVRNAVYRVNTAALKRPVHGLGDYLGGAYHMVNDDRSLFESRGLTFPYKLEAYGDDPAVLAKLRAELVEAGFSVSSAYADNLEVMSAGCGKGAAVQWLASRLGIAREACMAFGDNLNDLSMLDAVGWPVAVENAVPELRAIARIIAPECAQDGVAQTIERALKGEIA